MLPTATELVLDRRIRFWALIPISIAAALTGILRYYVSALLIHETPNTISKLRSSAALSRALAVMRTSGILHSGQFEARRHYFTDLHSPLRPQNLNSSSQLTENSMSDMMIDQSTGLLCSIIPQMVVGTWVRQVFGGYAVCRLPFPLSHGFRGILQVGLENSKRSLDVSYVSGLSWYVVNLFGNASVVQLLVSWDGEVDSGLARPSCRPAPVLEQLLEIVQGQDFLRESRRTSLESIEHHCVLPDVERVVLSYEPTSLLE
jgi:ER membrane protein complex subunit 3